MGSGRRTRLRDDAHASSPPRPGCHDPKAAEMGPHRRLPKILERSWMTLAGRSQAFGTTTALSGISWSPERESNPRPTHYEGDPKVPAAPSEACLAGVSRDGGSAESRRFRLNQADFLVGFLVELADSCRRDSRAPCRFSSRSGHLRWRRYEQPIPDRVDVVLVAACVRVDDEVPSALAPLMLQDVRAHFWRPSPDVDRCNGWASVSENQFGQPI